MDACERAGDARQPISIARCRQLLGDEADTMTDEEVERTRQHAETMAAMLVELYEQRYRTVQ
jgi:hypothetical protein